MRKLLLASTLLFPVAAHAQWQQVTVDNQTVDVLLPQQYDPTKSYPLVEFLHQNGMGCCREALEGEFTADFQAMQAQHPSIVIMPLLNQTGSDGGQTINFGGVGQNGGGEQFALDAVAMAEKQFSVNKSRVYVTGASMGGQGTDQLMVDHGPASAQPVYAAGLSMAGTMINDPASQAVQSLEAAPVIAVHGSQDSENLPGWDQQMADLDPSFHLTTVQGAGHDVWDGPSGYSDMALWNQLFGYALNGPAASLSMSRSAVQAAETPAAASLGGGYTGLPTTTAPSTTWNGIPSTSHAIPPTDPAVPSTATPLPAPAPVTPDPSIPRTIGTTSSCAAPASAGTGQFVVENGQITAPDGARFIAKGVNASEYVDPNAILNLFPGVNFVRLAVPDRPSVSDVQRVVSVLTGHDVVVEIEDHPWPEVDAYSGSNLVAETSWYASLAAAFKGNPYVWFGTLNEPQGGDVAAQQVATYNAIRGTGSQTILMMEAGLGGGDPGQVGAGALPAASYAGMHNVAWDLHNYGWIDGGSTDQAAMNSAVLGSASGNAGILGANTIKSADGAIPVIIGEFGPACCNVGTVNGDQVINSTIWAVQQGYAQGFAGWGWDTPDEDSLTNGGGSLTSWGNILSMAVASSCQQLSPGIAAAPATTQSPTARTSASGSSIAVGTQAAPAAATSPLGVDSGAAAPTQEADTDQSFQDGTQEANTTISDAVSAVDAQAKARMQ